MRKGKAMKRQLGREVLWLVLSIAIGAVIAAGVDLECSQGCAWKTLSFGLSGERAQAVDAARMAEK